MKDTICRKIRSRLKPNVYFCQYCTIQNCSITYYPECKYKARRVYFFICIIEMDFDHFFATWSILFLLTIQMICVDIVSSCKVFVNVKVSLISREGRAKWVRLKDANPQSNHTISLQSKQNSLDSMFLLTVSDTVRFSSVFTASHLLQTHPAGSYECTYLCLQSSRNNKHLVLYWKKRQQWLQWHRRDSCFTTFCFSFLSSREKWFG